MDNNVIFFLVNNGKIINYLVDEKQAIKTMLNLKWLMPNLTINRELIKY